MLRINSNQNVFASFFSTANHILNLQKSSDIHKKMNELVAKQKEREKPNKVNRKRNQVEICEDDLLIALLVLCDLRRYLLGGQFSIKQIDNFNLHCDHLENLNKAREMTAAPLPRSIKLFNNYMVLISCYAKFLVKKCETKNHATVINHALAIVYVLQQFQFFSTVLVADPIEILTAEQFNQYDNAYRTISEDKRPNNEAEEFLYLLNQFTLKHLFLTRAQLIEEANYLSQTIKSITDKTELANLKIAESGIKTSMANLDSCLKWFNLIEFPECRKKLSAHTHAIDQALAVGNFEPFRYGALSSLSGIMTQLNDPNHFKSYIFSLIEGCKILSILDTAVGLLHDDNNFKMHNQQVTLNRMLSSMMCNMLSLGLVEDHFLPILPETRYIKMMLTVLACVKTTAAGTSNGRIDDECYDSIDLHDLKASWAECLLAIRPSLYLARFKPAVAYTKMKAELLSLVAEHEKLPIESRADHAKFIMEYFLICLHQSEKPQHSALLIQTLIHEKINPDVNEKLRSVYTLLYLKFTLQSKSTSIANSGSEFEIYKHCLDAILSNEVSINAMLLNSILDHIKPAILSLQNFGTPEQKVEANNFNSRLLAFKKDLYEQSLQLCFDQSGSKDYACVSDLHIEDFETALNKTTIKQVKKSLVTVDTIATVPAVEIPTEEKRVGVAEFFETALNLLKISNPDSLESAVLELTKVKIHPNLIFNAEQSTDQLDAALVAQKLKDMLQLIIYVKRSLFGASLPQSDLDKMAQLIESLYRKRYASSENGILFHLNIYISHTALICKTLINRNDVIVLKNVTELLLDIYHWAEQSKKMALQACTDYSEQFCQQLTSGLLQFTENDASDHVFSRYVRELLLLTLNKLFTMQDILSTICTNNLAKLPAGFTRASTYSNIGEISCIANIIRERHLLAYIKILAARFQLDTYPAYKEQIATKPLICETKDIASNIKDLHERFAYLTKAIKTFVFLDERNYKCQTQFNEIARLLAQDLERDVSLFIADLKKLDMKEAPLNHLNWLLQVVKCYNFTLSKCFPLDELGEIKELALHELHFNDYFKSCSLSLSMLLYQRADFLLQTISSNDMRLDIFKKFRNELDFLFSAFTACPEDIKPTASMFIMEYFFSCFKLAIEKEEYLQLLPLISRVKKELFLDAHIQEVLDILCKYYRYVPNVSDAQYLELFNMLDSCYSKHKFNFSNLKISAYFYASYHALLNSLITKFKSYAPNGDTATRLAVLIHKLQAAVTNQQEFENELISNELRLDNKFDVFNMAQPPKAVTPEKTLPGTKSKSKKKKTVKKASKPIQKAKISYIQSRAETVELPELHEWPYVIELPRNALSQNDAVLFATRYFENTGLPNQCLQDDLHHPNTNRETITRRNKMKPLVSIPPKHSITSNNSLAEYYINSPLVLGRTIMLSEVDCRYIHSFINLGYPTYIYGDRVCSSIYDLHYNNIDILCFATSETLMQYLEENREFFSFKSIVHNPQNDKLFIYFENTNYHISITCRGGQPLIPTMKRLCEEEFFNTALFFDINTGYFFDINKGAFFNNIIAYSRNYLHQDFNFKPTLDIVLSSRLPTEVSAHLILNTLAKLGHYEEFSMGTGQNLTRFILNHKKSLYPVERPLYSLKTFDALFIKCSPLNTYKWLHKKFNALRCLFPMLDLDKVKAFKMACLKHAEKDYRHFYDMYNEAELTAIRAEMLVDMFFDSFKQKYSNVNNFKSNLHDFYQSLPFALTEDEHLLESIYLISFNRFQTEAMPESQRVMVLK